MTMYNARTLAQRLLLSRRDLDWDQKELAVKSGVSQTYISQIERGRKSNVSIDVLFALADALGVTVTYLLGISEDPLGQSTERVQKEMNGESVIIDVDNQELRQLVQETIDLLITLPARDRRIAIDLLRNMRRIEEEKSGPLVPRIIE